MSALYVHIPFCDKKCFYCSFAVSVGQKARTKKYLECLNEESKKYSNQKIETIFIGGGTPTLLQAKELKILFDHLNQNFDLSNVDEITIEANPEGLTKKKLSALKECGVSRISLGVQTLNEKYLKYLGRIHNKQQIYDAYDLIRNDGFDNVSLDLMFGFPDQTIGQLEEDVKAICELGSTHLSLYALTIDPKSRFFTKGVQLQSQDEQAEKYAYIIKTLPQYGFHQYEVSNFSKEGFESLHNIKYWQCEDYIGLGMGAHSFVDGKRFSNVERLTEYIKMIDENQLAVIDEQSINQVERLSEALIFGLRMNRGINLGKLEQRFNQKLQEGQLIKLKQFVDGGLIEVQDQVYKVTDQGRMVLDTISAELI